VVGGIAGVVLLALPVQPGLVAADQGGDCVPGAVRRVPPSQPSVRSAGPECVVSLHGLVCCCGIPQCSTRGMLLLTGCNPKLVIVPYV
jgi:hypothetical protein